MERGILVDVGGRAAVRFRRLFACDIDRLWSAITEPDQLMHWFPGRVRIDLRKGGKVDFYSDQFAEDSSGTILELDAPTRSVFTWGNDELQFTLESHSPNETALELIDVLEARSAAARNAASWGRLFGATGGAGWRCADRSAGLAADLRKIRR